MMLDGVVPTNKILSPKLVWFIKRHTLSRSSSLVTSSAGGLVTRIHGQEASINHRKTKWQNWQHRFWLSPAGKRAVIAEHPAQSMIIPPVVHAANHVWHKEFNTPWIAMSRHTHKGGRPSMLLVSRTRAPVQGAQTKAQPTDTRLSRSE